MSIHRRFVTAAVICMPGLAAAQVAGNYSGSDASGNAIQFTVGASSSTGNLEITYNYLSYSATCRPSPVPLSSGLGFSPNVTISNGNASYASENYGGYVAYALSFSADGQSATGTLSVSLPIVDTSQTPPKRAQLCVQRNEPFSVTLQSSQ